MRLLRCFRLRETPWKVMLLELGLKHASHVYIRLKTQGSTLNAQVYIHNDGSVTIGNKDNDKMLTINPSMQEDVTWAALPSILAASGDVLWTVKEGCLTIAPSPVPSPLRHYSRLLRQQQSNSRQLHHHRSHHLLPHCYRLLHQQKSLRVVVTRHTWRRRRTDATVHRALMRNPRAVLTCCKWVYSILSLFSVLSVELWWHCSFW